MLDNFEIIQFVREILSEARPSEIISNTSQSVRNKSSTRDARLSRVDRTNSVWHFSVPGQGQNYTVKIKVLEPTKKLVDDSNVLVTCNCPFFRWQGPEHWASVEGYLYQVPAGTASRPDIMDPSGENKVCKHAISALEKARNIQL